MAASEHRVAHRTADQRELLAGLGEALPEGVDHRRDPVQLLAHRALRLDHRHGWDGGYGTGVGGGFGHDRPLYRGPRVACRPADSIDDVPRRVSSSPARRGRTTVHGVRRRTAAALAALACGALLAGPGVAGPAAAEPDRGTRTEQAPPSVATAARLSAPGAHAVAASATAAAEDDSPLELQIDSLTPSYVPEKGKLRIGGTVTNTSDETFTGINVHAFIGDAPITSVAELAAERERDPADYVGARITVPGSFDTIDELEPGASTRYQLEVTRQQLGVSEPGVYWFGVHALGDSDVPRDEVADGRARTFLPLVPGKDVDPVPTALVIPVRHRVRHAADGSVEDVEGWARTLAEGGLLRSQVDFGASAGSQPVSWLVDPAVIDTVTALTEGNLPRSLDDTPAATEDGSGETPGPGDSSSSGEESASPGDGGETDQPEIPVNEATEPGLDWLERFGAAVEGNEVLGVPYGDLDVSGAAAHDQQGLPPRTRSAPATPCCRGASR